MHKNIQMTSSVNRKQKTKAKNMNDKVQKIASANRERGVK